jgi:glucose dehydrogenase
VTFQGNDETMTREESFIGFDTGLLAAADYQIEETSMTRHRFLCSVAAWVLGSSWALQPASAQGNANVPVGRSNTAAAVSADLNRLQRDPSNWPMQLGNYAGWRYTPLHQINRDNVKDLKIGWQVSTGVLRGHEGGSACRRRNAVLPDAATIHRLRHRP